MFSKDGGVCTMHFESVVENIKKWMLTLRTSICTFGVILGLCVRMASMNVSSNVLISFSISESVSGAHHNGTAEPISN